MRNNDIPTQFGDRHRCKKIITDNRLIGPDTTVFGAAICPHEECSHQNPLHGDPDEFQNVLFRCLGCRRIILVEEVPDDL